MNYVIDWDKLEVMETLSPHQGKRSVFKTYAEALRVLENESHYYKQRKIFDNRRYNIGELVYGYSLLSRGVIVDRITGIDMGLCDTHGVCYILGVETKHVFTEASLSTNPMLARNKLDNLLKNLTFKQRIIRIKSLAIKGILSIAFYQKRRYGF